jgi:hypothetical protein
MARRGVFCDCAAHKFLARMSFVGSGWPEWDRPKGGATIRRGKASDDGEQR